MQGQAASDAPSQEASPRPGRARSGGAALALATGLTLGLREVFEPPARVEIEAVDPWLEGGAPDARVWFHWHRQPPRSVVVVR